MTITTQHFIISYFVLLFSGLLFVFSLTYFFSTFVRNYSALLVTIVVFLTVLSSIKIDLGNMTKYLPSTYLNFSNVILENSAGTVALGATILIFSSIIISILGLILSNTIKN